MEQNIQKAIKILKNGGIVIFPTDTAFGIGCRIDDEKAIKRLFGIRKRPETKAVPVLFDSFEMVKKYVEEIPQDVESLMKKYWPGALTLILQCNKVKVPSLVRGKGETLGVRIPDHKIILRIISEVGVPILGPSANFSGGETPYCFEELDQKLIDLADYVVKGETSNKKMPSTVIDCATRPWKVIREGAIEIKNQSFGKLRTKIKNVVLILDTADNKQITVGLIINGQKDIKTKEITSNKTQIILPMIDEILKKHAIELKDLSGIEVNRGPGSFTGLRVGLAIANAMSFALKIPVNGKKVGEIILPIYPAPFKT